MKTKLRDEDFNCGRCEGELVPVGIYQGLKEYACNTCQVGGQYECPVCHKPRTLWAKAHELCFICEREQSAFSAQSRLN